jgi:formylglycine-generating enzyme required for sulfatase activity
MRNTALAVLLALLPWPCLGQEASWPDLSQPAQAVGGGEHDAAVVVGVENYVMVPGVPGAQANAKQWYEYLTETRGVPAQNVKFLTNEDATREEILDAARKMAQRAGPQGTLWFVFVGHGAPSPDGKDGLLIGVDAQQKAQSLEARGLRRQELLNALAQSKAGSIVAVLDACFSGRGQDGATIVSGLQPLMSVAAAGAVDPRMVVLTAAKGNQFAGALPGAQRPAFSYLVLGGLRGWAAEGKKAALTAGDLWRYATNALEATLRGRNQTPDLLGKEDLVVGVSAGEKAPSLARLAEATAGGAIKFNVSALPAVPKAEEPKALGQAASGLDLGSVDVDALEKYDAAVKFDKGEASAEDKAAAWRGLAKDAPKFADLAGKRAAQWDRFAEQKKAADEARQKRVEARDADWQKLSRLLALGVVPEADKQGWAGQFLKAYMKSPGLEPGMAKSLVAYAAPGPVQNSLKALARKAPKEEPAPTGEVSQAPAKTTRATAGKAGIEWVNIPGGSFMMGSDDWSDTKPRHEVTIKSFQMAKTLVTNKQYQACVAAGACTAPDYAGESFKGDDQPAVSVDWNQAKAFSEWVGGRLPSEAEWEYAARSGGKEQRYPWGDEEATCERAVMEYGCGRKATWPVCSKPTGNTKQGLCDMAGNVMEWVQDWYHRPYAGAPTDGSAWENPTGDARVARGGAWDQAAGGVRSALRFINDPGDRFNLLGFRPAR